MLIRVENRVFTRVFGSIIISCRKVCFFNCKAGRPFLIRSQIIPASRGIRNKRSLLIVATVLLLCKTFFFFKAQDSSYCAVMGCDEAFLSIQSARLLFRLCITYSILLSFFVQITSQRLSFCEWIFVIFIVKWTMYEEDIQ